MENERSHPFERRVAIALLAACWIFCAAYALNERIDRDEHMYLAAATLSADMRLYEDFAFLQTPYSVGIYRAVLAVAPDPWTLLPARIFKTFVTAGMMALLYLALRRLGSRPLLAAGLISLLYMSDLVRDIAAIARNYDFAQLTILAGVCIAPLRREDPDGPGRMMALGALAAISVGFKLTYAPLAVLLVVWPAFQAPARGPVRAAWIVAGAVVGFIPAAVVMADVNPAVLRANLLDYHFINAEFHSASGNEPLASIWDRLSRVGGTLLAREHRPLVAMSLFALALNLARWSRPRNWAPGRPAWFVLAFLASTLVIATVPRPLQNAYFGPAFFGMALFVAMATARLTPAGRMTMLGLCLATCAFTGASKFEKEWGLVLRATVPENWTGVMAHRIGDQLRELAEPGRPIATTHPLFALDGGLEIYPEFATGEFAWRSGALLGRERRSMLRSTSAAGLGELFAGRPPGAIVTETDAKWDLPLDRWAAEAGWSASETADPEVRIWAR